MAYNLVDIMGIGEAMAEKLNATAGLKTVEDLLAAGASKKGRAELAKTSGIDEKKILRWINMADLFRIKGISEKYSNLLELAGVDTVKELRNRNTDNLHAKMKESNEKHNVVDRVPSLSETEKWVAQAKEMEPMVTY